ncbi:GNAT family N-acetyltransferase [Roseibium aggregatum]|uniref:GNAT family N-acetyltransferase n=1 Tax=Roseibium aggregatum TaxID=187304 RepID=UPI003A982442
MALTSIAFETMTPAHLDGALALSAQAGWPHRREDWEMGLSVSRGVVGIANDRVIATCLMTPYGEDGATINLVIVEPSMRRLGLGRRLMSEALTLAGNRTCYLVATQEGLPLYEKLGFVVNGAVVQHQGVVAHATAPEGVAWANPESFNHLVELDRTAYGHDRTVLMQELHGNAQFAVIHDEGEVQAFAAIRFFGRGKVIGPVVARSDREARRLIDFLLAQNLGHFVRVDTNSATGLGPWLAGRGLAHAGGGIAMVLTSNQRKLTKPSRHWTYALASQALG